jgi:mxaK protein
MTRNRVHMLFGTVAVVFGIAAAWQAYRLDRTNTVNEAIAAAANPAALESALPEARFARAVMLAKAGVVDDAAKTYKLLIQENRTDLKRAALYNLGNLHMREAAKFTGSSSALPFVELAKQNYRDLLREDSEDWDARYNLERALWLSPELDQEIDGTGNVPEFTRRVAPQSQGFRIELP